MNSLIEVLKIAKIHIDRIEMARRDLKNIFPVDQNNIKHLSKQNILLTELLVSRFAKLQDLIGRKIIDKFLLHTGEFIDDLTMIDKINKLERLGIVEAELWKDLRDVRNHATHEYPDHPEITAKYLNSLFVLTPQLIKIIDKISKAI